MGRADICVQCMGTSRRIPTARSTKSGLGQSRCRSFIAAVPKRGDFSISQPGLGLMTWLRSHGMAYGRLKSHLVALTHLAALAPASRWCSSCWSLQACALTCFSPHESIRHIGPSTLPISKRKEKTSDYILPLFMTSAKHGATLLY